jgi:hypothetical protein
MKPLTNTQKAALSQLAKRAWEIQTRAHAADLPLDAWRAEQAIRAVGCRISAATQAHYLDLKAHFLTMAGETDAAFETALRAKDEPVEVAIHALHSACTKAKVPLTYAKKIALDKYQTDDLERLESRQIWHLVYSVKRAGSRRRQHLPGGKTTAEAAFEALRRIRHASTTGRPLKSIPMEGEACRAAVSV